MYNKNSPHRTYKLTYAIVCTFSIVKIDYSSYEDAKVQNEKATPTN